MKNRKVEEKVNTSFSNATPDMRSSIANECKGAQVYRVKQTTRKGGMFWKYATLALALILVVTAVVGGIGMGGQTALAATVSLDVNPSVQIKLNKNNKVISVEALNADGKVIIGSKNFKGADLELAVDAIIGSMLRNGYLSDLANSVLVSVDTDKQSVYDEVIKKVAGEIELVMKGQNVESSVVTQWIKENDKVKQLLKQYPDISMGKAQLICKIVEASSKNTTEGATVYTVEQLVELSVNDLSIILGNLKVSGLEQNGSASGGAYISETQALTAALAKISVDVTAESIIATKSKLDFDDGVMVWEIEFVYGGYEYDFEIGAVSGTVLSFEQEIASFDFDEDAVVLTDDQLKTLALTHAGLVAQDGTAQATAEIEKYAEYGLAIVYFETAEKYYEYEMTLAGTILYKTEISLVEVEGDSYMTRKQAEQKIRQELEIGQLETVKQFRINFAVKEIVNKETGESKTLPIYSFSLVHLGTKYTGELNAIDGSWITQPTASEVTTGEGVWNQHFGQGHDHFDRFMEEWEDFDWEEWDDYFEYEYCEGGYKYEVEFDRWGNIVSESKEWDNGHNYGGQGQQPSQQTKLTKEEALQVVANYLGLTVGELVLEEQPELDTEGGMSIWEIELILDGKEVEIKVNAVTGVICKGLGGGHHGNGYHYGW